MAHDLELTLDVGYFSGLPFNRGFSAAGSSVITLGSTFLRPDARKALR